MDVLVLWKNGTKNIVDSRELKLIRCKYLSVGCDVKMLYDGIWYKGTVIAMEDDESHSEGFSTDSENVPLSKIKQEKANNGQNGDTVYGVKDGAIQDLSSTDSDDLPLSKLRPIENIRHGGDAECDSTSSEEIPLARYINPISDTVSKDQTVPEKSNSFVSFSITNNEADPTADPFYGQCELRFCKNDVWSACHRCQKLLCYDHFLEEVSQCSQHGINRKHITAQDGIEKNSKNPEDYVVEGAEKETENKQRKPNKQKQAKKLRDKGEQYVSPKTRNIVPARCVKARCNSVICKKYGKQCDSINEDDRNKMFRQYYALESLQRQREFLSRHMERHPTQRKTTGKADSRRSYTVKYYLTKDGIRYVVCKKLFLNTLSLSSRSCRTVFHKLTPSGILEKDKRGGRQRSKTEKENEAFIRKEIEQHIGRFPRVESHYCRSSSSRQYLHPDLSLPKMFYMFLEHLEKMGCKFKTSYYTYRRVFKTQNLSFHNPKKDQCSLCMTYNHGDEEVKSRLAEKYKKHVQEKIKVRELKAIDKQRGIEDEHFLCSVFDLQQVIYVPISKENAIYYKSRLSTFNLTFYNIANRDCFSFPWHECLSKRGSSEIATCIFRALEYYSKKGTTLVSLYSDGCYGQNKNSIVAAMLLYVVNNFDVFKRLSLRFFESNHGQSEGDSAHSAIHTAIATAGDIFEPSQLHPIIKLARRKQPYLVKPMNSSDFIDFKKLSQDLRILTVRVSEKGQTVKWTEIREFMVTKDEPTKLFFKYSHCNDDYDAIELKRLVKNIKEIRLQPLNKEPPKLTKKKYADLVSLCEGPTPVVRSPEIQDFYKNLPHDIN